MARGRFVTLEGGEGAGKTTQRGLLAAALRQAGIGAVETREPGGAPGAEEIRRLLVSGAPERWDAMTETLLHFAARRDHLVHTVWPALEAGSWVVSDRFADSTRAYQGYGHGLGLPVVETLYRVAVGDFAPDLTIVLDVPVAAGIARTRGRDGAEDRYERMDRGFHERLRAGFLEIAAAEPARCVVVDATAAVETVHAEILKAVRSRLGRPA